MKSEVDPHREILFVIERLGRKPRFQAKRLEKSLREELRQREYVEKYTIEKYWLKFLSIT